MVTVWEPLHNHEVEIVPVIACNWQWRGKSESGHSYVDRIDQRLYPTVPVLQM